MSSNLERLSNEFDNKRRDNKEYVTKMIERDPNFIQFASGRLKNDKEFVLKAVKEYGSVLQYANLPLRNNKEIVLESVKSCNTSKPGDPLKYSSEELRNDKEIVLEAVKTHGRALKFASEELRNDKRIVFEAVKDYGEAIKFASHRLRNDKDLVLEGMKVNKDPATLCYSSKELRNDKDFILFIQKNVDCPIVSHGYEVNCFGKNVREDGDFLKKIVSPNVVSGSTLLFFSESVDEEAEENELMKLSKCFEEVLKSRNVLDIFPPTDGFYFNSIGLGAFGVSYKVDIQSLYGSKFKESKIEDERMSRLFDSLKKHTISKLIGVVDYASFVIKFLHNPDMKEEKRIKLIEKDSLSIPYHKNIATVLFQRCDIVIDIDKFGEYEKENWKKKLSRTTTNFRTGVLIMKYYKQDLSKYVKNRILSKELQPLSKLEFCRLIKGVIHGVSHLHSNFIVHRNLHPGNIFLSEIYGRVWIGDFGCCLDLREKRSFLVHKDEEILYSVGYFTGESLISNFTGGCDSYIGPEILKFDKEKEDFLNYSKSDLYSVGILSLFLIYSFNGGARVEKKEIKWGEGWKSENVLIFPSSYENWISKISSSL